MDYSILLAQAALNGLVIGAMYTLMAVGFTLVFGIMRVVNFAHGEFYMLGAFAGLLHLCAVGNAVRRLPSDRGGDRSAFWAC